MAEDPYSVLGVGRAATGEEIRRAYRAKAKANHPDLHPDDKGAEARFKTINAANDLLSDPEKRGRFDRGEIDAEGQGAGAQRRGEQAGPGRAYYRDYAQAESGQAHAGQAQAGQTGAGRYGAGAGGAGFGGFDEDDLQDAFGAFFSQSGRQGGGGARPRAGRDRTYRLDVPFLDTVNGATERLTLPDGQSLDVRIPPGLADGQVLRLRGKGEPGVRGGPDGDALIEVSVFPHPVFRREGADLVMDVPVTFAEAVLGARIDVPTPRGRVVLGVPPRSEAGTRLRLRGRGVAAHAGAAGGEQPAGDLYAALRIVLGPVDEALEGFLKTWRAPDGADVRAGLGEEA